MSFKTYAAPLKASLNPLTAIAFGAATLRVTEGVPASVQLKLTPLVPEPAPTLTVKSSDPAIVVADILHGYRLSVIGIAPGTADITVAFGGLKASLSVTVEQSPDIVKIVYPPIPAIPVTSLALTHQAKSLSILQQFDLGALVQPYGFNRSSIQWSNSDRDVVEIADVSYIEHDTGIYRAGHIATIRGLKTGSATVTASISGLSASCVITVT